MCFATDAVVIRYFSPKGVSMRRSRDDLWHSIAGCCDRCGDDRHGHSARRSEEHTSELQSQSNLVCRLLLEKKKTVDARLRGHEQRARLIGHRGRVPPPPLIEAPSGAVCHSRPAPLGTADLTGRPALLLCPC